MVRLFEASSVWLKNINIWQQIKCLFVRKTYIVFWNMFRVSEHVVA